MRRNFSTEQRKALKDAYDLLEVIWNYDMLKPECHEDVPPEDLGQALDDLNENFAEILQMSDPEFDNGSE